MMGDMGGLRAIVNAGEKVRTGQFLIFLHIALVHIDANHPSNRQCSVQHLIGQCLNLIVRVMLIIITC